VARVSSGKESKQDYQTPRTLVQAVEYRFGKISLDLAASAHNKQSDLYFSLPGDPAAAAWDSLSQDWAAWSKELPRGSLMWLNPEFKVITPWVEKCRESAPKLARNVKIGFLVPASVGSNWYADNIFEKPNVQHEFLKGRVPFMPDKPDWLFPKDCLFALFGKGLEPAIDIWDWRDTFRQSEQYLEFSMF
jgi:phage N-6-adenine-methyltransferase